MSVWSFFLVAPSVLWMVYRHIRRERLDKILDRRAICHDEKFWIDHYPRYQSTRLMALLSNLSMAIKVPVELIDPTDKLSDITISDALASDELDDAALLLMDEFGVDENDLKHVVTVDDYIHTALRRLVTMR